MIHGVFLIVLFVHQIHSQLGPECGHSSSTCSCRDYCQSIVKKVVSVVKDEEHCAVSATAITDCCDVFLVPLPVRNMTGVFWQGQVGGSRAFCDMRSTTSGGGWQLFIFYSATKENFNFMKENDLSAYRSGFSSDTVYWLGLDKLHQLTSTSFGAQLRIEVVGGDGFKWAEYDNFSVGSFEEKFKLTISGYNNKSTLVNAMELHDGALFSAPIHQKIDGYPFDEDMYPWDNDKSLRYDCTFQRDRYLTQYQSEPTYHDQPYGGGGWWYLSCCYACPFHKSPSFTVDHIHNQRFGQIQLKLRIPRPLCLRKIA